MAPFISLWIINILEFSGFSCHRFSICQRKHRERCLPIPRIPPDQGWHAASKELASGWKVKRIGSDRQSWRGKVFRQARQKCLQRWEAKNESRHRCKVSSKLYWDFYKKFEAGGDNFLHIWQMGNNTVLSNWGLSSSWPPWSIIVGFKPDRMMLILSNKRCLSLGKLQLLIAPTRR